MSIYSNENASVLHKIGKSSDLLEKMQARDGKRSMLVQKTYNNNTYIFVFSTVGQ